VTTEQIKTDSAEQTIPSFKSKTPTRRGFLKLSAGSTLATLWALEGCGRKTEQVETPQQETTEAEAGAVEVEDETTEAAVQSATTTDQRVRVAFAGVPLQFDPAVMSANSATQAGFTVYEGLVWVDRDLTIQPALAVDWEATDDLLSWTFTLRQDVQFHHGTSFTAQDVVYTFKRLLDPVIESPLRSVLNFVETVEAIDDGTATGAVRFGLTFANADLPLLCGAPQALIVSHEYSSDLLPKTPSGTGPFRVDELIPGQRILFVRNEQYWGVDKIALQAVEHIYMPSFEARAAALKAGEVDLLSDISSHEADSLFIEDEAERGANGEIVITESPSGAYQTVVMQATETPFTDLRVRQALKLCLDRVAVQDRLLGGRGELGQDQPVASINPFHLDLPMRQQEIAEAQQLLSDAGYPDGLTLDLITAAIDPGMVELAYLVQEMAAPAGFEIRATEVPADVYWGSYWGQVPFHIGSWNFRPSIGETLAIAYHSQSIWNESRWSNLTLDALLEEARNEADVDQRKVLYQQAQELISEEGAVVIPVFRPVLTAMHKRVENFMAHPAGWIDLRGVKIAETAESA